jgi:hypothetical protein
LLLSSILLQRFCISAGRDADNSWPPQDRSCGMREFDIVDPDGNMIFFDQEVKKAQPWNSGNSTRPSSRN